jgi:hypothetical protein
MPEQLTPRRVRALDGLPVARRIRRSLAALCLLPAAACAPQGAFLSPIEDVRVEQRGSSGPESESCGSFRLSDAQAAALLKRVVVVTARQIHDNFEVGSCYVRGRASIGHAAVTWELRAGGTGEVRFADAGDVLLVADPRRRRRLDE